MLQQSFDQYMTKGNKPKREYDKSLCLNVGNLGPLVRDNDFFKFFKARGYNVRYAKVMLNDKTKKSRGFGYLTFYSQEEADRCYREQNNVLMDDRYLVLNKQNV